VDMEIYARSADGTYAAISQVQANETEAKISLFPAAQVKGRLVNAKGEPVANTPLQVKFTAMEENFRRLWELLEARTGSDGRFEIRGMPPGQECALYLADPQGRASLKKFQPNEATQMDLGDVVTP
jgi:hypothetical protein